MPVSPAIQSVFDVESFINEYYDAWSGTDLDRIMSYYAEDIVLQIPGLVMRGKEAVRDQFARPFTTAFPGNHHLVKNMIFGPDMVSVEFSFEAKHTGPFAGHAASGARISLPGCAVYQYDSAKRQITSGRIYFDVGTLLQTITDALVGERDKFQEVRGTNHSDFSRITNVIPTFIQVLHTDGSVLHVNQAVLSYTGLTLEDVRRADYRDRVFHPEDLKRLRAQFREALTRPVPFENEQRVLGKDGRYRWFLIRFNPLLNAQGNIDCWSSAAFDIEDRKRAEDAQARQAGVRADVVAALSHPTHLGEILRGCTEAIVRRLDVAFARIWLLNKEENVLELQASAGMYTRLDGSYSRIPVGELKVGWIAREKKAHLTNDVLNDPRVHDKRWARDNGMVAFAGYPLIVEDRLIGVVALFARRALSEFILDTLSSIAGTIAQGIERKRAEEDLRNALDQIQKSESKLRQVIDAIPALAWCNLPDGPNEFLNKGWHEYTGLTPEESHGWGWQVAFHPDDLPPLLEKWTRMLTSGVPDEIEARLRRHDGIYRWFLIRAQPFRDESGNIVRWYGTSTDIDDRKKAEEALQASEANLNLIINTLPALIHTGQPDGSLDYFNGRWLEYLNCSLADVEGWNWTSWIHPDDVIGIVNYWKACLNSGEIFEYEARVRHSGGQYRWMFHRKVPLRDGDGNIVRWYGTSIDIEDRKRAEAELNQAHLHLTGARAELAHMARVTTLSTLTTSIAHEINQPIAAAINSAGACLRWLNRDEPEVQRAREAALRIEDDAKRAAEIISHLKSFYKKDVSPQREMVSVNEVVREMLVLLRSEADRHSVTTHAELPADVPAVSADRVQLQQVLMNLMLNGMEAMTDSGGELQVSTGCDNGGVIVSVRDTGMGIPGDNIQQIFKAFFTTKVGGTGMGLAISSAIIESHGGRIWATVNRSRGATFHFSLPV